MSLNNNCNSTSVTQNEVTKPHNEVTNPHNEININEVNAYKLLLNHPLDKKHKIIQGLKKLA